MQQDENQAWQQPSAQLNDTTHQVGVPEQDAVSPEPTPNDNQPASGSTPSDKDDEAVLRWEGPEYIEHDRNGIWYAIFAVITLVFMALSIFLLKSVTFTVLIPVMAVALFVYTRRPAQHISYTLSRKGIYVNDKLHPYSEFKAFAVNTRNGVNSVIIIPRKRFQIALTAYFSEEVGEALVDMLAARLPMQTYTPDFLDKLLAKLRI